MHKILCLIGIHSWLKTTILAVPEDIWVRRCVYCGQQQRWVPGDKRTFWKPGTRVPFGIWESM